MNDGLDGIRMIEIGLPECVDAETVNEEVKRFFDDGTPISDAAARTIASWWQSPGTVGNKLAQLASTGTVAYDDLIDDIDKTQLEARRNNVTVSDKDLDALREWAAFKTM